MRLLFALLTTAALAVQPAPTGGAAVYEKLVRSTVWIHSTRGSSLVTGSGSLVDRRRMLVLTNYHVVGDNDRATVVFPIFRDGRIVAERDVYLRRVKEEGIRARVIARDQQHDLALLRLESVPAGAFGLPLAEKGVTPGQNVYSVGNPGASGALWVYTPGQVRQVYRKQWKAEVDGKTLDFSGEVVETDSPTNPGDSGGPLVNDRCELVAVTHGGAVKANLVSTFIDVSEVKKFLNSEQVRKAIGGDTVSVRTTPLPSSDGGRFVSEETLKKFNDTAKEVYQKTGKDLVYESYAQVPDGKTDEVKAMTPKDRQEFFHKWATARVKAEDVHGILLLVCREPSTFYVWVPRDQTIGLKAEDHTKLVKVIGEAFKEKKFDEGVTEFAKDAAAMLTR